MGSVYFELQLVVFFSNLVTLDTAELQIYD